jgi:hypothetical protein
MDRPRRISTALLNCPELRGVSAEAEVLAHRLSLVCDDFGRARLDADAFTKTLFPRHPEARGVIEHWCKELEGAGFIERYCVGAEDYIRLRRWAKDQAIDDPRPSDLPPSPTEPRSSTEKSAPPANETRAVDGADTKPRQARPSPVVQVASSPPMETSARTLGASVAHQPVAEEEPVELRLARLHGRAPRRTRYHHTPSAARSL